ncbi:hypothetical protein L0U85_14895 [Glycomyces sp. L485]|uniref:hypothetical protein n=1 Tax=Glycomyces sp. L485 TaxID=2909235 RepID=UPI001F4AF929|nr:hypothetical protein [Glycomyces sp. L485]MCH7232133.1 hypothetical protein [Glycomyces sp. L485]
MDTLMWEAKARSGLGGELLEWVLTQGVAGLGESVRTEVFTASGRVVVIVVGHDAPRTLPDPPEDLVERPPHAWPFTRITTSASYPNV